MRFSKPFFEALPGSRAIAPVGGGLWLGGIYAKRVAFRLVRPVAPWQRCPAIDRGLGVLSDGNSYQQCKEDCTAL